MNEGVQILLERMKTHPEEFDGVSTATSQYTLGGSKWGAVISRYWEFLTEEELTALKAAVAEANRQNLTSVVLRTLTNPPIVEYDYLRESQMAQMSTAKSLIATQGVGVNITNPLSGTGVKLG